MHASVHSSLEDLITDKREQKQPLNNIKPQHNISIWFNHHHQKQFLMAESSPTCNIFSIR